MKKITSYILLGTLVLAVALSGCGGGNGGGGGTKSNNADLSALTVSSGTLVPQFDPAITGYTVSVANNVTSVTVTGTKADANASVSGPETLSNLLEGETQTAPIIVTAQNGTTKTYTVAVTRTGTSTKAITLFSFEKVVAVVINEANHTIAVTVPYGTNVNELTPVIGHTGASVEPASGVTKDFSSTVTYTVKAEDGSEQKYIVTVTKEPNSGGGGTEKFTHTVESVSFDMRRVPGGLTFPTDSAVNAFDDAATATVANAYWIAETEVTYELWYYVYIWAVGQGYKFDHLEYYPREGSNGARVPKDGSAPAPAGAKREPVTTVCWREVIVWCNALSKLAGFDPVYKSSGQEIKDATIYADFDNIFGPMAGDKGFRLPTGNEWELAARYKGNDSSNGAIERGGLYWTPGAYASGATDYAANKSGVINDNQNPTIAVAVYNTTKTAVAGSKDPNALNLYDMSGNVYEWCFDRCPGSERMTRGGYWYSKAIDLRLSYVYTTMPNTWGSRLGFRIVRTD
jgi:sulfatase modifying factor 1